MDRTELLHADPLGDNVQLDAAVVAELPPNSKVVSVGSGGPGHWVKTVKIVVELEGGSTTELFKKGASGPTGANMMKGAFEAEQALYDYIPDRVPKPVAWGTYASDPDTHFYLSTAVSALHLTSKGKSPTGQFGFHVTTHLANVPVDNSWNSSWEAFWAQQMKSLFDREESVNGTDETLAELRAAYFEKAIPRYLGPLESEGRSVTPSLLHSDLWPGNIKPRTATGELCLFDACAYWGHNEADLAICYNPRYKLGQPALEEYKSLVAPSEPGADFYERNALYAMKYHVLLSIMYSDNSSFREKLMEELKLLLGKLDSDPSVSKPDEAARL
ncbi:Fructosamine kinase-domain-containing protein [Dichotomopilus funicola]|uniref:protein-ribulosamine 3-kinase n=1 Tax=Dichotomopilus funicola TaxID=1934379 RepID=A0AAN6V499_9PEZI|nr:Fructosamine kinase-domain-containing protein [Dichotomopilus funicola]